MGFLASFLSAPSVTLKIIMLPYVTYLFPFVLLFFLQWERKGRSGEGEGGRGQPTLLTPMFICVVVLDNPMIGVHPLPVPAGKLAEANDKDVLFLYQNVELVISQGLPGT